MAVTIIERLPVSARGFSPRRRGRDSTVVASSFMHAWGECTLERIIWGIKTKNHLQGIRNKRRQTDEFIIRPLVYGIATAAVS